MEKVKKFNKSYRVSTKIKIVRVDGTKCGKENIEQILDLKKIMNII